MFKPKQKFNFCGSYSCKIKNYSEELDENGNVVRNVVFIESTNPKVFNTAPVEVYSLKSLVNSGQPLRRIPTDVMSPNQFSDYDIERIAAALPEVEQETNEQINQ